ncbi:AI-2E family transporter [Companilactobacillus suantsaicola]|uniref:AI-2E family transporter n=1 Tax=Companilactobacillus suantsaicola TaxID=2487723 RepID=A0A4Z0JKF5_9LACO|nr:AI-2E family transporter [Companilactobacillus suantsaicola]TGD23541.1 AI-2E family transporter [Companilactobacillus suantsaicola]
MKISKKDIIKYSIIGVLLLFILIYPVKIYGGVMNLLGVLMPLILGAVMAYVLNILCVKLEKYFFPNTKIKILQKSRRGLVILSTLIIVSLVLAGVFWLVLPQFFSALSNFFKYIPSFINDLSNLFEKINHNSFVSDQIESMNIDWSSIQAKVMKYLTSGVGGVFGSTFKIVSGITKGFVNFILALTFAIYILATKEKLGRQVKKLMNAYMTKKHIKKVNYVLHVTNNMFSSFIAGQVTEAIILGSLCAIGMLIFRLPYALSVGAFISITALIPILGAWLGGIVGFLLIAVESPIKAVFFVIFILVLQQFESNVIYPRVVGTSIGLPGIWVLAAITVGGGLNGIVGMLLGVPVAATIYQLVKNDSNRRLNEVEKVE